MTETSANAPSEAECCLIDRLQFLTEIELQLQTYISLAQCLMPRNTAKGANAVVFMSEAVSAQCGQG